MASKRRRDAGATHDTADITSYRYNDTRPNNPPAALAAEGRLPPAPKLAYSYSPRLDPALRSDPSGKADALPPLLEKATREALTAEEAGLLAEALRRHQPWLEWAGKRETPGFAVDPVALHIHERVSTEAILRVAARQDVTRDGTVQRLGDGGGSDMTGLGLAGRGVVDGLGVAAGGNRG